MTALTDLVREFYSNTLLGDMEYQPSEPSYMSYFRGYPIDYSPTRIRGHLRLFSPDEEKVILKSPSPSFTDLQHTHHEEEVVALVCQPGKGWTKTMIKKEDLAPKAAVWAHFVLDTLYPNSNKSDIRGTAALLIHCLMRDIPIDVAKLISYKINATLNVDKMGKSLPYPGLVTELVKSQVPPPIYAEAGRDVEDPNPLTDEAEIQRKFREVADIIANPGRRRPGRRLAQRPVPVPQPQTTEVAPPMGGENVASSGRFTS